MKKHSVSILLTLCIILTLLPTTAMAAKTKVNILSLPTKLVYKLGDGFDTTGLKAHPSPLQEQRWLKYDMRAKKWLSYTGSYIRTVGEWPKAEEDWTKPITYEEMAGMLVGIMNGYIPPTRK